MFFNTGRLFFYSSARSGPRPSIFSFYRSAFRQDLVVIWTCILIRLFRFVKGFASLLFYKNHLTKTGVLHSVFIGLPLRAKPVLYATGRDYTPRTCLVKGFGTPISRLVQSKMAGTFLVRLASLLHVATCMVWPVKCNPVINMSQPNIYNYDTNYLP